MAYLLDIMGSFAIGALVLLMLFRFNQTMLSASNEKLLYNISQLNTVVATEVIEYDFYKIGYRVNSDSLDVFEKCELSGIEYLTDIDNNGVVDTIEYSLSGTDALEATVNPNDKLLYRYKAGTVKNASNLGVTDFTINYYDNTNNEI